MEQGTSEPKSHRSQRNYIDGIISQIENDLTKINKPMLIKLCKGFKIVACLLEFKDPGIFQTAIKWCRLYLDVHSSINPNDQVLLQQYEKTIPTALSFMIGFLQYKSREVTDFHFDLLLIINDLVQNSPRSILNKCANLGKETISCLWKPIDCAKNSKTQFLALGVFSALLKELEQNKRDEILEAVGNVNVFKDELNTVIQETMRNSIYENASRKLLNDYNRQVNNKVYSLYCNHLNVGNSYDFFKPLNCEHFWIDFNYNTQTVSFTGRVRLESNSKYENALCSFKVATLKLEDSVLLIYFEKNSAVLPFDPFTMLSVDNIIKIFITAEEEERLKSNANFMSNMSNCNIASRSTELNNYSMNDSIPGQRNLNDSPVQDLNEIPITTNAANISANPPTTTKEMVFSSSSGNVSPVSRKQTTIEHCLRHPIRRLRPKRLFLYTESDEDYVPNKRPKRKRKLSKSSKMDNSKRRRTISNTDNESITSNQVMNKETPKNNIVYLSNELSKGNECFIHPADPNNRQSSALRHGNSINNNAAETPSTRRDDNKTPTFKAPSNTPIPISPNLFNISSAVSGSSLLIASPSNLHSRNASPNLLPDAEDVEIQENNKENQIQISHNLEEVDFDIQSIYSEDGSESVLNVAIRSRRESSIFLSSQIHKNSTDHSRKNSAEIDCSNITAEATNIQTENNSNSVILSDNKSTKVGFNFRTSRRNSIVSLKKNQRTNANSMSSYNRILETSKEIYEKDINEAITENNLKIEKCLNSLRKKRKNTTPDSNHMQQEICKVAENVLEESKKQGKELQELKSNMQSLIRQMESKCQIYMKRSKLLDLQKNAEQLLKVLSEMDIENGIADEYKALVDKLTKIEMDIRTLATSQE